MLTKELIGEYNFQYYKSLIVFYCTKTLYINNTEQYRLKRIRN